MAMTTRANFPLDHSEIFRLMVERSPLPISIQDANWEFVFVNQAYCDFVGYELTDLLGRDPATFLFPSEGFADSRSHRQWASDRAKENFSQPGKIRELVRRDGRRMRFRADMGHSQTADGADLWCGILFDLTEIGQLQSELTAFEGRATAMQTRFDSFAELSNEGMMVVNARDVTVSHANSVVNEITGVKLTGEGQPFSELLAYVEPEDVARVQQMISRGGSRRGTEINVVLVHPESGKRSIRVRSFSNLRPESEIFVLMEDITEHIHHEEHRLSVEVIRRDAVVKEIHHRVNNQLHGVMTLLESSVDAGGTTQEAIETAIARINAIASLNGLLTTHNSDVSVLQLVVQIVSHAEKTLGNHVRIEMMHDQPELTGLSIDNNAVAIALVINDLLSLACRLSDDDVVSIQMHTGQATLQIRFTASRAVTERATRQSDSPSLTLARALLHGSDSTIDYSLDEGLAVIALTLGPQTLNGSLTTADKL